MLFQLIQKGIPYSASKTFYPREIGVRAVAEMISISAQTPGTQPQAATRGLLLPTSDVHRRCNCTDFFEGQANCFPGSSVYEKLLGRCFRMDLTGEAMVNGA